MDDGRRQKGPAPGDGMADQLLPDLRQEADASGRGKGEGMKSIDEIRAIVNATATTLIRQRQKTREPATIAGVLMESGEYLEMKAKARAYDEISEILTKEEESWWN